MDVILRRVECIATRGELREEPCLHWRIDEDDDLVGHRCLGDRGMRQGETSEELGIQLWAERKIELRLTEYDGAKHRYDDCLGTINFVVVDEFPEHLDSWHYALERRRRDELRRGGWSSRISPPERTLTLASTTGCTSAFHPPRAARPDRSSAFGCRNSAVSMPNSGRTTSTSPSTGSGSGGRSG